MFRFLLRLEDGEPNDPAVYVSAILNYSVGETFPLGRGERLRILAIDDDPDDELVEAGINGIFTVEPV